MIQITLLLTAATFSGADWPTFRGDAARSGASKSDLSFPLTEEWVHSASGRPQNAWPGPARHDLYSKTMNLTPRLWFDRAFYVSIADGRRTIKELEDTILRLLAESSGNILDDEQLINTLDSSKQISKKTEESVRGAEETTKEIDIAREAYRPVATRGSILYFVVADFAGIDPSA